MIGAIIEARMSSSRLPGKVLLKAEGQSMLEILVSRLKCVSAIDAIIIATTVSSTDDAIELEAARLGVICFRGSENDVMARVLNAARSNAVNTIVEITGDCPLIDPTITSLIINSYLANDYDYASNCAIRSFPDGMDVQVYSTAILEHSSNLATTSLEREHVTLHIRRNPELYSHLNIVAPEAYFWPELGLTLDEEADFRLIAHLIEFFQQKNPGFSCLDCINYLKSNPHLLSINSNVKRKGDK